MSFNEGNLHDRVDELQRANESLRIQLSAMVDFAKRVQADADELEALVRDMANNHYGDCSKCIVRHECEKSMRCIIWDKFKERMAALGIEV